MSNGVDTGVSALDDAAWRLVASRVEELEQLWHSGSDTDLSRLMPPPGDPLRHDVLVELIKVDQEHRWKSGDCKTLEAYLAEWRELAGNRRTVADLLSQECLTRAYLGEMPDAKELGSRFPEIADTLDLCDIQQAVRREQRRVASPEVHPSRASARAIDVRRPSPLRVGQRLGRYEIVSVLGRGGMATVYCAVDNELGRHVALKIPRWNVANDPVLYQRFLREARAAASIRHTHICRIFDAGAIDGHCIIAMEIAEGKTLTEWMGNSPAHPRTAAGIIAKLAGALQAVHESGFIHRDIKSSNVMLQNSDEPILMDFGLAKPFEADARLTSAGELIGTPAYMSPEQANGKPLDARSDIYSLGVVLYEMLTGTLPFTGAAAKVLADVGRTEPVRPHRVKREVDGAIEAICLKAMARNPADRYQSAREFARDALRYLDGESPIHALPRLLGRIRWLVAAAILPLALLAGVVLATGEGTLKVVVNDLNVSVTVDGVDIQVDAMKKEISLRVGTHRLMAMRTDGSKVERDFTIRWRGNNVTITIDGAAAGTDGDRVGPPVRWIPTKPMVAGMAVQKNGAVAYVTFTQEKGPSEVHVYDLPSGACTRKLRFREHSRQLAPILSDDERYLYTVHYYGRSLSRIDLRDGEATQLDLAPDLPLIENIWANGIAMTPDGGRLLVCCGCDGRNENNVNDWISVVDVSSGAFAILGRIPLVDEPLPTCLAVSPRGKSFYLGTFPRTSKEPRLYEISLTPPFEVIQSRSFPFTEERQLRGVAASGKLARVFVSDGSHRKIRALESDTLRPLVDFEIDGHVPGEMRMNSDETLLLVLAPATRTVFCVDPQSGDILARLGLLRRDIGAPVTSADGRCLFLINRGEEGGVAVVHFRDALTRIVFASDRAGASYQLYTMSGGGQDALRIDNHTATDRWPRWSPDGRQIAFVSDRAGPPRVCFIGSSGGPVRVSEQSDPPPLDQNPRIDWSPDGRRVALISADERAIRAIDLATQHVETLVTAPVGRGHSRFTSLSWQAVDRMLLFSAAPSGNGHDNEVFAVDPSTRELTQLTNDWGSDVCHIGPVFSSDGVKIAALRVEGHLQPPRRIVLLNSRGSLLRHVFEQADGEVFAPRWCPAGDRLTFAARRGSFQHIFYVDVESRKSRQLTDGGWNDVDPDVCSLVR